MNHRTFPADDVDQASRLLIISDGIWGAWPTFSLEANAGGWVNRRGTGGARVNR